MKASHSIAHIVFCSWIKVVSLLILFFDFPVYGGTTAYNFDFKRHTAEYLLSASERLKASDDAMGEKVGQLVLAEYYLHVGSYAKADSVSTLALSLFNESPGWRAWSYIIKSEALYTPGFYDQAYEAALNAFKNATESGEKKLLSLAFQQLAVIYARLNKVEISEGFLKRSITISTQENDIHSVALGNFEMGHLALNKGEVELALRLYSNASELFRLAYNNNYRCYAEMQKGVCFANLGNTDMALAIFQQVLFVFYNNQEYRLAAICLLHIGNIYDRRGDQAKATYYYKSCYEAAEKINEKSLMSDASGNMALSFEQMKKFAEALTWNKRMQALEKSILNEQITEQINRMDAQYQNAQKQNIINDLNKQNEILSLQQKQQQLWIIAFVLLLLIAILALVIYRQRLRNKEALAQQQQIIHEQEMQELITAQQLKTVESIMENQESERKRIASDLHDRVGSLLSTVKLYFKAVEHSMTDHPDLKAKIQKSGTILDQATAEVRKISHDMESGVLEKFGLVPALQDLCDQLNETSVIKIHFNAFAPDQRLNEKVEASLYRCAQEVITNCLKHAEASEISVELTQLDASLTLIISDNGKGFDPSAVGKGGSLGMKNIRNRVELLKGKLSIDSNKISGTTVIIEIPL